MPEELGEHLEPYVAALENGDFEQILRSNEAKALLDPTATTDSDSKILREVKLSDYSNWSDFIFRRLGLLLGDRVGGDSKTQSPAFLQHFYFLVALAALYSFVQSNVTGPTLPFVSADVLFPKDVAENSRLVAEIRRDLILSLGADGEAAYKLTPNIELLCLAETILVCPPVVKHVKAAQWAWLRVNFLHQRLLSDPAPTLQSSIYVQLDGLAHELLVEGVSVGLGEELKREITVAFLLERASIHTHHGFDKKAREDLDKASAEREFSFALTGRLGKRTKYQEKDTSQLVVLARSKYVEPSKDGDLTPEDDTNGTQDTISHDTRPNNLDLNDDTLLESISFTKQQTKSIEIQDEESLPAALKGIDPENQPLLGPLDSIILLSLASSIKNTSPEDGLTREETLPYATRVLEGGSSNWQVYTQALLVRSRIEGFKSRTMERGLLQLQVLVDQVIAETTSGASSEQVATSFLPKAKESESAPVNERLRFVFQLASPSRWELESELAQRWVTMGGLRSALDIFERLEMWAEAALCWAATEREDKAKLIVRRQLFHATDGNDESIDEDTEKWEGNARDPPPADAPRLYCILGDIDKDPSMFEKAWEVSNERYARAQRSLGRHYFAAGDFLKAANAYSKSLKVNQLNQPAWFAMGCALLQLSQFERAAEAFSRTVQLDDSDAEGWSNLAAALLNLEPDTDETEQPKVRILDEDEDEDIALSQSKKDPQQHRRDALKAFKRASRIKFDSYRIWDNVLTVAASLSPPSYTDVVTAQKRIIDIRGSTDGEKCVDVSILEMLLRHIIETEEDGYDPSKPGLTRMAVEMIEKAVVPLITASKRLWQLVARLQLWRRKPSSALESHEKAWRVVTSQPNWESSTEEAWNEVVDATVDLVDAYQSLGTMERTEGLAAGSGELVMKDWKFKSRSAIRGVLGKGKDSWEGTEGWERLQQALEDLRNA